MSVLNGRRYVPDVVDYLRRQSFQPFEAIIVVSSLSTDGTLDEARSAVDGDPRLKVVEYQDVGALGGSKNAGIDLASGRYLWFLDVDDVPSLDFLKDMVRIKEEHQADLVGCNFVYSDERSPLPDYGEGFGVVTYTGAEALRARATERFPVTSWSMLYDAGIVNAGGIRFPLGICEDILFTYSVLEHSSRVCYYEKPLYKYVVNPHSVTRDRANRDRRGLAELDRYDVLEERFRSRGGDPFLLRRFALLRTRSAGHMSLRGFYGYMRSDRYVGMLRRNMSFEGCAAFMLPALYYIAIRVFFLVFYYRPGRAFTGGFFRTVGGGSEGGCPT